MIRIAISALSAVACIAVLISSAHKTTADELVLVVAILWCGLGIVQQAVNMMTGYA